VKREQVELAKAFGFEERFIDGKYHQTNAADLELKRKLAEIYDSEKQFVRCTPVSSLLRSLDRPLALETGPIISLNPPKSPRLSAINQSQGAVHRAIANRKSNP
jgi:hypothetical protein